MLGSQWKLGRQPDAVKDVCVPRRPQTAEGGGRCWPRASSGGAQAPGGPSPQSKRDVRLQLVCRPLRPDAAASNGRAGPRACDRQRSCTHQHGSATVLAPCPVGPRAWRRAAKDPNAFQALQTSTLYTSRGGADTHGVTGRVALSVHFAPTASERRQRLALAVRLPSTASKRRGQRVLRGHRQDGQLLSKLCGSHLIVSTSAKYP